MDRRAKDGANEHSQIHPDVLKKATQQAKATQLADDSGNVWDEFKVGRAASHDSDCGIPLAVVSRRLLRLCYRCPCQ